MDKFLNIIGALNDESRVLILAFLAQNGELCVCDLQNSLNMIQSRLSRHLKILKDSGFLEVRRKGTWAYYKIMEDLSLFHLQCLETIKELNLSLPSLKKSCKN
ncbi:ArsR/SmtB family transcription factor [Helicobacter ibis]|uniref:Metalloregulator ArsR/SmtB family transcription factor n=1 Tax=Helicobacter ibis TaxID=2962633 RepID=A0ABT4VD69_9HELI|nr:metalloregulator ArsR/SmtB family transcription factor [Helicobacter ibis]MDA3968646.1 metalloregulator ArsR/SmtB family transcription factor [Helicobacter ibis]